MTEHGNNQLEYSGGSRSGFVNVTFLLQPCGILKIAQMVLSFLTFICATSAAAFIAYHGGGWVQFVSMTAFLITGLQLVLYIFKLVQKIPQQVPFTTIEMIYYAVTTVFFFIAFIVCVVKATYHSGIIAATIFSSVCTAVYGMDAVMTYLAWRRGESPMPRVGAPQHGTGRSATAESIGTSDISPGVYAGSDLKNPNQIY